MPALNKVLTNMIQSLTDGQKARARFNIDAAKQVSWNNVDIDISATSLANSVIIGSLGIGFSLYYYLDSGSVRLALMNNEGYNLSVLVSSSEAIENYANKDPDTKFYIHPVFSNSNGQTQYIRFFCGDRVAETVVTVDQTNNKIWYKIW